MFALWLCVWLMRYAAAMVGVYVHVCAIFMWCACCMCVHVLCIFDDASGVWLAIVGALGARV